MEHLPFQKLSMLQSVGTRVPWKFIHAFLGEVCPH